MTALVTGAGGAIGRATAVRLATDGHAVAIVDRDEDAARETVQVVERAGGVSRAFVADVADDEQLDGVFASAEAAFGRLRVLVNNAAVFPYGPFLEMSMADHDTAVRVNQRAYYRAAQLAAHSMVAGGGGAIVNVASITWHGGWENLSAYVATKGAVVAMTRALASELGRHDIRVNAVAPGAFPSAAEAIHPDRSGYEQRILDAQALKRRGRFDEVAAVVAFLAGEEASFVTGQTINVDGGWIMV